MSTLRSKLGFEQDYPIPDPETPPPATDLRSRLQSRVPPGIGGEVVTEEDIQDWANKWQEASARMTRAQIVAAIREQRAFPGGLIGVKHLTFKESVIQAFGADKYQDIPLSIGQKLQSFQVPGIEGFGAGGAKAVVDQGSFVVQGASVLARTVGASELSARMRTQAEAMRAFGEKHYADKARGVAGTLGGIAGNVLPSMLSLGMTGGAWAPVMVYYGLVGFGAGSEDIRAVMKKQGVEPSAIQEFAVGLGYAIAEVVPEYLGLEAIGRIGSSMAAKIGDAILDRKYAKAAALLIDGGLISSVEGVEEGITQLAENMMARGIPEWGAPSFDPARPVTQNLWTSFWQGMVGGAMLIGPAATFQLQEFDQADMPITNEVEIAQEAMRAMLLHEPGMAHTARPAPTSPLETVQAAQAAQAPVAAFVAAMTPQQVVVAQVAASQAVSSPLLSKEDRAKARHILDELDKATQEQGVQEVLQKRREHPTRKEINDFWEAQGWHTKKPTVAEVDELQGELRSARRIAETILPRIRQQVRELMRGKAKLDKQTRAAVRRLVSALVPAAEQARYLGIVARAHAGKIGDVLDRIALSIERQKFHDALDELRGIEKVLRKAKITREERTVIRDALKVARHAGYDIKPGTRGGKAVEIRTAKTFAIDPAAKTKTGKAKTAKPGERAKLFKQASETIESEIEKAEAAIGAILDRERLRALGELERVKADQKEVIANVNAPDTDPLAKNPDWKLVRWIKNMLADVRNLARGVEHKKDNTAVLERLLWREMTRAHEKYHRQMSIKTAQLEESAKRNGFKSLADALAQMSGVAGESLTEMIEVTVGAHQEPGEVVAGAVGPPAPVQVPGKTVSIPLGMAAWFYAIDEETRALIEQGTPLQSVEGRLVASTTVNADELEAIRNALPQNIKDFVDEAKAIAEEEFKEVAKVVYRLTGRDPKPVPGYFRRRRHMLTKASAFPETWRDAARRYAEKLGFLREREGGTKSAILVEDFLTATIDHMTDIARVQHVAEPTRRAAGVLLDPDVQNAIVAKHGVHTRDSLIAHLEAASMVNPVKTDQTAQFVRLLNSNVASAKLGINPTSWLKQLGGWSRLIPFLGTQLWQIGIQQFNTVTMDEITRWSGFFWDRYVADIAGRFGSVIPSAVFGTDQSTFKVAIDHATQAFHAGNIADGVRALRAVSMSTLQILNFFDGVIARTAWAAYKAQVNAEHPDWSEARRMEWVAEKASDAIRETQNSSSVLDLSTMALQARGRLWSIFLLFSSDRFKTANRLRRAFAESKERGAQVLVAELGNMAVGAVVGNLWPVTVALILAALGGDKDELEEAWKRAIALDRNLIRAVQELVTLIDPTGALNELISLAHFQNKAIFESAAQSTLTHMGQQMARVYKAIYQVAEGKPEKALHGAAWGAINATLDMAALGGLNPLDTQLRLIFRTLEKRTKSEEGLVEGF